MSGDFFQPGRSSLTRQSSGLPAALSNAAEPRSPVSESIENVQPGQVLPSVVILTALPGDFLAVKAHLSDVREQIHPETKTVYELGRFMAGQGAWNVLLVETGQGNNIAGIETQRAIDYFKPDVVLFVGTAGGRKGVEIGDVVAGSKIYNYESGKDEEVFRPRPEAERASYPLEQRARAVVRAWLAQRNTPGNERLPRAFVGAIAAGESVVASTESDTAKLLHRNYGDALAVEKEGYGFLAAARQSQGVSAIVIRGISNLLDDKETADKEGSPELAAKNASVFAFEMLANLKGGGNFNASSNDRQTDNEAIATFADETIQMSLERQFPKDVVILYVEARDGQISLKAFNSERDSLEPLLTCPPPPICLYQMWDCSKSQEILGKLLAYKPRKCGIGQFLGWLLALRKKLQEVSNSNLTQLIINDRTDFEIPWEMLYLPEKESLGTIVQIIRWHDIDDADTWEPMTLPLPAPTNHYCQGKVLIHAGVETMSEARRGIQALQSYQVVHCSDSDKFLSNLQQSWSEFGLIFISSYEFQCLSKDKIVASLSYTADIKSSPSMVMIDSSSFPLEQPAIGYRELVVLLLECGLKGAIGTLRAINDQEATQVVGDFFVEHERERNVPIPEILRQLRVNAAQRLQQAFNEENCLLYLSTCMYTYHGNQMTMLALTPVEESP